MIKIELCPEASLFEIQMMRRLARQAAKDLRPIEGFFYAINRPVPTSHPASPHFKRLHPLTNKFLKEWGVTTE
jgi:hypothetical protein